MKLTREQNRIKSLEWRRKNPERSKEIAKKSYYKNRDKILIRKKIYVKNNKEKRYANYKKYYRRNPINNSGRLGRILAV